MATFHCSVKHGKVGNGKLHCDYINREGRYANGPKKEELVFKESGNLPSWANTASDFFNAADIYERKNGTAYSEFEIALPNELSLDDNIKLVREFINKHVGKNKPYSFAIHDKQAALDNEKRQPHCHVMFSERIIDPTIPEKSQQEFFRRYNSKNKEKGGYRKDDRLRKSNTFSRQLIASIRESWANQINAAYEKNGLTIRVTHLSNESRINNAIIEKDYELAASINSNPSQHLGPKIANQMIRDVKENKPFEAMSSKAQYYFLNKKQKEIQGHLQKSKAYLVALSDLKQKEIGNIEEFKVLLAEQFKTYRSLLLAEKEHTLNQEQVQQEKEKVLLSGYELSNKIMQSCKTVADKLKENNKAITSLENEIIPRSTVAKNFNSALWKPSKNWKRMKAAALSIYTKGATKRVNDEAKKVKQQKRKFETEWNNFVQIPVPAANEYEKLKSYHDRKKSLESWQKKILVDEQIVLMKADRIKTELRKPEHRKKIAKILNMLRKENNLKINNLNALKSENKELRQISRRLLSVQKKYVKIANYRVPADLIFYLENKESHSVGEIVQNLKKAARTLEANENALPKGNNMKINFHDDSFGSIKI